MIEAFCWITNVCSYCHGAIAWLCQFIECQLDFLYLSWVLSLLYPAVVTVFILPFMILFMLYLSSFVLYLYTYRRGCVREVLQTGLQDPWVGGRYLISLLWDAHGYIWHGYEVSGLHNIPPEGHGALIVYYHGAIPLDVYYLVARCITAIGRHIHCVGDRFLLRIPGWQSILEAFRVAPCSISDCVRILSAGNLLAVSPGGVREAQFSDHSYALLWGGRTGFAKVAIQAGCPIIPMFTSNLREAFRVVQFPASLWASLYSRFRLPFAPIYGGFPVKLITHLGPPVHPGPGESVEQLACRVQAAVARLVACHQRLPGSIRGALLDRICVGLMPGPTGEAAHVEVLPVTEREGVTAGDERVLRRGTVEEGEDPGCQQKVKTQLKHEESLCRKRKNHSEQRGEMEEEKEETREARTVDSRELGKDNQHLELFAKAAESKVVMDLEKEICFNKEQHIQKAMYEKESEEYDKVHEIYELETPPLLRPTKSMQSEEKKVLQQPENYDKKPAHEVQDTDEETRRVTDHLKIGIGSSPIVSTSEPTMDDKQEDSKQEQLETCQVEDIKEDLAFQQRLCSSEEGTFLIGGIDELPLAAIVTSLCQSQADVPSQMSIGSRIPVHRTSSGTSEESIQLAQHIQECDSGASEPNKINVELPKTNLGLENVADDHYKNVSEFDGIESSQPILTGEILSLKTAELNEDESSAVTPYDESSFVDNPLRQLENVNISCSNLTASGSNSGSCHVVQDTSPLLHTLDEAISDEAVFYGPQNPDTEHLRSALNEAMRPFRDTSQTCNNFGLEAPEHHRLIETDNDGKSCQSGAGSSVLVDVVRVGEVDGVEVVLREASDSSSCSGGVKEAPSSNDSDGSSASSFELLDGKLTAKHK